MFRENSQQIENKIHQLDVKCILFKTLNGPVVLHTEHNECVTAPHEDSCYMTHAHLSPHRHATEQVADKRQYHCSASPGMLPSVCAHKLASLCWKTNNCWRHFVIIHIHLNNKKWGEKHSTETFY